MNGPTWLFTPPPRLAPTDDSVGDTPEDRWVRAIDEDEGEHRPALTRLGRSQPELMAWIGAQVGQERAERQLAGVARYQVAVALRVLELLDEPAPRVGAAALSAAEGCVSRAAERVVDDEGTFEERARRLRKVRPALLDGLLASMFAPGPSLLDETRTARAWVLVWVAVEAIELARGQRGTNERESA